MINFEGTEDEAYEAIAKLFEDHDADHAHNMLLHDFRNLMNSVIGGLQVLNMLNEDCATNAEAIATTVGMMDARSRQVFTIMIAYFHYQRDHDKTDSDT